MEITGSNRFLSDRHQAVFGLYQHDERLTPQMWRLLREQYDAWREAGWFDRACTGTADGHHGTADRDGRCRWCQRKITNPVPAPRSYPVSDLTDAYGYTYDPDYR